MKVYWLVCQTYENGIGLKQSWGPYTIQVPTDQSVKFHMALEAMVFFLVLPFHEVCPDDIFLTTQAINFKLYMWIGHFRNSAFQKWWKMSRNMPALSMLKVMQKAPKRVKVKPLCISNNHSLSFESCKIGCLLHLCLMQCKNLLLWLSALLASYIKPSNFAKAYIMELETRFGVTWPFSSSVFA